MSRLSIIYQNHLRYEKLSKIYFHLDRWWREYCKFEYATEEKNPEVHDRWVRDTNRSINESWDVVKDIIKSNSKQLKKF